MQSLQSGGLSTGPAPTRRPVFTVFTEARFNDDRGRVTATDGVSGETQWERYSGLTGALRVAGRCWHGSGQGGEALAAGRLVPLRSYDGPAQAVKRLPALIKDVMLAVSSTDVALLRVPGPIATVAAVACRALGRPYAVEVVGDPAAVLSAGAVPALRSLAPVAGALTRVVVAGAGAARYVTDGQLQALYPAAPGAPTFAISDARIPDARYAEGPRERSTAPVLLAVGSQATPYKGHDIAIRALQGLRASGLDASLRLVGEGAVQAELRALASSLGLAEHVDFVGALGHDDVLAAMRAADVLVHPSRTEGLPRVVQEAMSQALPVVATAVGGVPELLDAADLVPVDDAEALTSRLAELLADQQAYRRASERNLTAARAFTQSRVEADFARWVDVLGTLPRRHARSGGAA